MDSTTLSEGTSPEMSRNFIQKTPILPGIRESTRKFIDLSESRQFLAEFLFPRAKPREPLREVPQMNSDLIIKKLVSTDNLFSIVKTPPAELKSSLTKEDQIEATNIKAHKGSARTWLGVTKSIGRKSQMTVSYHC